MNQERDEYVIETFRGRKIRQIIALIPIFIGFYLLISADNPELNFLGLSEDLSAGIAIGFILISLIFSLFNWRCPNCNSYLGKDMSPKFCKKCGSQLQD